MYVITRKCVHLRENTQITSLHAEKCSELADWKRLTDHSNLLNKCLDNLTRAKPYLLTPPKPGLIGDLMTEIPLHKHCLICGNAVRPDENFCDELCESKFKSAQRKQQLLFVAFIVIMGLVLFLPSILKMKG